MVDEVDKVEDIAPEALHVPSDDGVGVDMVGVCLVKH